MGLRRLIRNLRRRDEAAAQLIPGLDARWAINGPDILGLCTATNPDTTEVVGFRLRPDGTAVLLPDPDPSP